MFARRLSEPAEEVLDAGEELLDSDVDTPSAAAGQGDSDLEEADSSMESFLDSRDSASVEAEGAAALAEEQREELLSGDGSEQGASEGNGDDDDQPASGSASMGSQADMALFEASLGTVEPRTWIQIYLKFLLWCAIRGRTWRETILAGRHLSEPEMLLRTAVQHIERRLLAWKSQGTLSTWVSAHPALYKAVQQLPFLEQQRCKMHGELQRCAVCYRDRETIKLFVFQGHPVSRSHYAKDDTGGITAPRMGERATSRARQADIWGEQQFGGSQVDTGSSSEDSDCLEADWGPGEWARALRCIRYGTRAARRQRRHDRKLLRPADLAQQHDWAWTGWIPPAFRAAGQADEQQRNAEEAEEQQEEEGGQGHGTQGERQHSSGSGGSGSAGEDGSSSSSSGDDAPISQRSWARREAAAGSSRKQQQGTLGRKSSQQHKQRQQQAQRLQGSPGDGRVAAAATPAAAAAVAGGEEGSTGEGPGHGRYNTRSSARKQPAGGDAARALAQLRNTTAKRLDFDAAAAPAAPAAAAAGRRGSSRGTDAPAAAAAAVLEVSSTESDSDAEKLADRQRRHHQQPSAAGQPRQQQRRLRLGADDPAVDAAAAAELMGEVDLYEAGLVPQQQRRRRVQQHVVQDEEEEEQAGADSQPEPAARAGSGVEQATSAAEAAVGAPAAAAAAAVGAPATAPPAAAPAAACWDDGEVMFTPSKRHRHQAVIDSDDEGDAGGQGRAAAAAAGATLQSPLKRLRHAARGTQQQQALDGDVEVVDLCDSQGPEQSDGARSGGRAEQRGHERQQQQEEEGQQQQEEEEEEERPYRRRGFRVGAGICAARLRLHHLLQHWPYKATLLLKAAYDLDQLRRPDRCEGASVEAVHKQVAEDLYQPAFKGIADAIERLVQLQGNNPRSQADARRTQELYDLVDEAEQALDRAGQWTYRRG